MAFVKTEVQGAVEIITIDRPKALNALNPEVLADLSLIHICCSCRSGIRPWCR